jgi:hypothetical protein
MEASVPSLVGKHSELTQLPSTPLLTNLNFGEIPKGEVRRIPIPRTPVNRATPRRGDSPARPRSIVPPRSYVHSPNAVQATLHKKPRERIAPSRSARAAGEGMPILSGVM